MGDTRGSWRSRGWVGGVVLALVASVLPIAQQIGSVDAAPEVGVWDATAVDPNTLVPIVDGTVTLESDGTQSPASFSYSFVDPANGGVPLRAWQLSTIAADTGTVTVPYVYDGFHSFFTVTTRLQAFKISNEVISTVDLINAGPINCCTEPSGGFSYEGEYAFDLQAGDEYGFIVSGSNFDSNSTLQGRLTLTKAPFLTNGDVADNTSWSRAETLGDSTTGVIAKPGESRWYKFPVTPDSQVQVTLAGLAANFDLAIYRDIEQTFDELTSPSDLARLGAQFAADAYAPSIYSPSIYSPSIYSPSIYSPSIYSPSIYSPSIYSPSIYSPSIYSPSIYSPSIYSPSIYSPSIYSPSIYSPSIYSSTPASPADIAFSEAFTSAQTRSLITVSALDGLASESIRTATWNNTGNFYVRVSGRNGAFSAQPFSLSLDRENGPCNNIAIDSFTDRATITGLPAGASTIILTDTTRFAGTVGTDYLTSLNALASSTNGIVVDVSQSERVRELNAQADGTISCAYLKNLVADAIRDIVVDYRASSPGLQYVVIAGGDRVIPFFRYADGSGLGPESDYIPPLASTTASEAALRSNSVLGQDAYGSTVDLALQGSELPVPDLPVGRLIETPAQIVGQVNAYLAPGGNTLRPASSLVTGYDFLTSAADVVQEDFAAGVGAANAATLITDQGIPTTLTSGTSTSRDLSWTADNLRAALATPRDAYFIAGHFSANSTLAADYSTSVTTREFVTANTFSDSLVISPGCHSGFNIQDEDGIPTLTEGLDWAQLMAEQHATLIAGTGYQYADTDFLAYSAKLYTMVTEQLRVGQAGTPVAVGTALMEAKRQYLEQTPSLSGIDKKSLIQATLYGLPMKGIDFATGRIPAAQPPTGGVPVSPVVAGTVGAELDLKTADVPVTFTTTPDSREILDVNGNSLVPPASFSWLVGPDGVQTAPAVPALPKQIDDVTSSTGEILRGVGFRSGTYTDTPGVRPLTGAPATEQNGVHTDFTSPVFWPQRLVNINYYDQIGESADGRTRLVTTPAQYRAEGDGTTNTLRSYSDIGLRLFYSSDLSDGGRPASAAPPSISQVAAGGFDDPANGPSVAFSAFVTGDPAAGMQEVWVTYTAVTGPLYGRWVSMNLTQNEANSLLWTGNLTLPENTTAADLRFMVQAANGVGLVGLDNNLGSYYTPGVAVGAPTPPTAVATSLTFAPGTPTGGLVGSSVTVSATLTGAPAGSTVTFGLGTATRTAITDAAGLASTSLPVQGIVGATQLTASFAGADLVAPSSTSSTFTVSRVPTTLALATSTANKVAGGIATGVTATLVRTAGIVPIGQQPVEFTVLAGADGAGGLVTRRIVTTDPNGVASLGVLGLGSGSYLVEARFAGTPTTFLGGNATPVTLVVDVTGPSIVVNRSPGANTEGWNKSPVTVTFTCGDVVGVLSCNPNNAVLVNTDGDTVVTATATDVLGNTTTQEVLVRLDQIAPTLSGAPTTAPNAAGWYRGDVVVRWTCADDRSGIAGGVCPADSTIGGEGVNLDAGADVTDVAGNPTVAKSPAVKIDRTAPVSTAAVQPATTSQVTVRIDIDDNSSGVATTTYQVDAGPPVTVTHAPGTTDPFVQFLATGAGPHTVRYSSTDVAGNTELQKVLPIVIDAAPDIRWSLSPLPNRRGWNNTNTTVTFTCIPKGTSVIATCTSPVLVTTEGKAQPVVGTAVTSTGVTSTETAYVSLDKTAPTITARASGQPNAAGWYDHPVNVQFKCTDALSGVRACSDDVTLKTDGVRTLTGSSTDAADNTSTISFGPIKVDRTDPVVRITGLVNGSTYDFTAMPTPSCTTTDATSGVAVPATLSLRYDGPMVKVRCTGATDVAGNQTPPVTAVFRVRNALDGISAAVRTYVLGSSAPNKAVVAGQLVRLLREGKIDRFVTDVRAQVGLTLTVAQADQLVLWSGLLDDDDHDHDDDDDDHDHDHDD